MGNTKKEGHPKAVIAVFIENVLWEFSLCKRVCYGPESQTKWDK